MGAIGVAIVVAAIGLVGGSTPLPLAEELLLPYRQMLGRFYTIAATGGQVIFNTNQDATVKDFSFRTWFRAARMGQDYVSDIYISALSSRLLATVAVPIKDADGGVLGVLYGGVII